MDIISYLSGKKAKKQMESLKELIGQDDYKHGELDVADTFNSVHERISDLEKKNQGKKISTQISDLTRMTAIELNKQALRVGSFTNAKRFQHTNMIFDDFKDNNSIDYSKSKNIDYYAELGIIMAKDPSVNTELYLNPIRIGKNALVFTLSFKGQETEQLPTFYISEDNGFNWNIILVDEIYELHENHSDDILIKMVFKGSQQVDAIAYSWK